MLNKNIVAHVGYNDIYMKYECLQAPRTPRARVGPIIFVSFVKEVKDTEGHSKLNFFYVFKLQTFPKFSFERSLGEIHQKISTIMSLT